MATVKRFLASARATIWRKQTCPKCHYDKMPRDAVRCPKCGWREQTRGPGNAEGWQPPPAMGG